MTLKQHINLIFQKNIHFLVQTPYFNFGLQIDEIVIFIPFPVFFFLPVLAHHDDWCLQSRNT